MSETLKSNLRFQGQLECSRSSHMIEKFLKMRRRVLLLFSQKSTYLRSCSSCCKEEEEHNEALNYSLEIRS